MLKRWGIFILSISFLCSCGKKNNLGIEFDDSVPEYQKTLLVDDLALVGSLNFSGVTQNDVATLGLNELTPNSLAQFVAERTKFIVGESYDYTTKASTVFSGAIENFSPTNASDTNVVTVMTNIGGAVYLTGKLLKTVFSLPVAGQTVAVTSPRVGIIKVDPGLFNNSKTSQFSRESYASRLVRLGVLFHESRHSDGNGENASFPHAMCNSGDFSGYYACESNLNGPYMVQAVMLKHFYTVCRNFNCSWSELSALQLAAADAASRLQSGARMEDPTPEGTR